MEITRESVPVQSPLAARIAAWFVFCTFAITGAVIAGVSSYEGSVGTTIGHASFVGIATLLGEVVVVAFIYWVLRVQPRPATLPAPLRASSGVPPQDGLSAVRQPDGYDSAAAVLTLGFYAALGVFVLLAVWYGSPHPVPVFNWIVAVVFAAVFLLPPILFFFLWLFSSGPGRFYLRRIVRWSLGITLAACVVSLAGWFLDAVLSKLPVFVVIGITAVIYLGAKIDRLAHVQSRRQS